MGVNVSVLTDVFEGVAKVAGKHNGKPKYDGDIYKDHFLQKARVGDEAALNTLNDLYYKGMYKNLGSFGRNMVRSELIRSSKRTFLGQYVGVPRGYFTGYFAKGTGRLASQFKPGMLKGTLGLGAVTTVYEMATAPKGHMLRSGANGIGNTIGGVLGAAIGGAVFGLPGEIVGGFIGGDILGKGAEKAVAALQNRYKQAQHLNFGQGFQDNEMAFTMRQRAVQELGRSALNARQFLGREAVLMHE